MDQEVNDLYQAAKEFIDNLKAAFDSLVKFVVKLVRRIKPFWKNLIGFLYKLPGYIRKAKAKQLAFYESISAGKSNNWRKAHGLHLARNNCQKVR